MARNNVWFLNGIYTNQLIIVFMLPVLKRNAVRPCVLVFNQLKDSVWCKAPGDQPNEKDLGISEERGSREYNYSNEA